MSDKQRNETDPRFYTLRDAAYFDLSAALQVLKDDPTAIEARNSIGETAFHFLVVENALDSIKWLLEQGSDINTVNNFGGTPLQEAAGLGYFEMCEFLLSRGANPEIRDQHGSAPIAEAAKGGHIELVKLFVARLPQGADINTYFEEFDRDILLREGGEAAGILASIGLKHGLETE